MHVERISFNSNLYLAINLIKFDKIKIVILNSIYEKDL